MPHPEPAPLDRAHAAASVLIPPSSRVLDVGCHDGDFARQLGGAGCTVVGIELDAERAADAAKWCERVIVADLETIDLQHELGDDQLFPVIVCMDVLEHLREPAEVLRRLVDVLQPGGRIIVSIPNVTHVAARLHLLSGSFAYTENGLLDRTHLRFFDRANLEAMIDEAGLRVIDRLYVRREAGETEIDIDADLPDAALAAARAGADADVYRFVWALASKASDLRTIGAEALWHELELARTTGGRAAAELAVAEAHVRSLTERLAAVEDLRLRQEEEHRIAVTEADDLRWRLGHAERAAAHRELIARQAREAAATAEAARVKARRAQRAAARRSAQLTKDLAAIHSGVGLRAVEELATALRRHPILWRAARSTFRRVTR